jgi:hypothetical protein
MSEIKKRLPIGIEDYQKMITSGYYYVDKTLIIKELVDTLAEVNLFLRPRRFGKTLALSTLRYFFEDTGDADENSKRRALFAGLNITDRGERYAACQTSFPVISVSLKSTKQRTFSASLAKLAGAVSLEYIRHARMAGPVNAQRKKRYARITDYSADTSNININDLDTSLLYLSECIYMNTGKKSIILIDEYDVPLDGAYVGGYYDEMIIFMRTLLESALKTNPYLEFAVMTGCLRVSQESIFTGMNNLRVISMMHEQFGEYFGFTQADTDEMLRYYNRFSRREDLCIWYDGYRVGIAEVYNPWSVLNCLDSLLTNAEAFCVPYWVNTSSNDILKILVEQADAEARADLETLMSNGVINKPISEAVTYKALVQAGSSLWGFMFFTGYLTQVSQTMVDDEVIYSLKIPNKEIQNLYRNIVAAWFKDRARSKDFTQFYRALTEGDAEALTAELSAALFDTISYNDYGENFYHGFFAGILQKLNGYSVKSNRESGTGRPDIALIPASRANPYIIIEFKKAANWDKMDVACQTALNQIEEKGYANEPLRMGYKHILRYGVAFWEKEALASH